MSLIGPKNDKSFDEAAYDGALEAAKKYPQIKIGSTLENRASEQQELDAVNALAPNNDIVIGVGGEHGAVFDVAADKFPNTTFIALQSYPAHYHKNVYSIAFDRTGGYEAGAIAAVLTKDNVIGFVGGAEIPSTIQAEKGFVTAIERTNPKIKVLKNITGDFNDVAKAKAATAAMLSDGADVIMPYLDAGVAGSYAAAHAAGKLIPMFKLDLQDCKTYPNMIGADIGDNTVAISKMLEGVVTGSLKPAGVVVFVGLEDRSLQRVELCPKYAKNEKVAAADKRTVDGINNGTIKMPAGVLNPRPSYPWKDGFNGAVQNAGKTGE
jgi:basic membrane lipoprotein Med (substrate-binding protein (PBP1-ABC) superfamily)